MYNKPTLIRKAGVSPEYFWFLDLFCAKEYLYEVVNDTRLYTEETLLELQQDAELHWKEYKIFRSYAASCGIAVKDLIDQYQIDRGLSDGIIERFKWDYYVQFKVIKQLNEFHLEYKECKDCPLIVEVLTEEQYLAKMKEVIPQSIPKESYIEKRKNDKRKRQGYITITDGVTTKSILGNNITYYTRKGWTKVKQ